MQSASLAIMAKIELLYEEVVANDATFLSFIPIALVLDADELRLAATTASGSNARAALAAAADFALLANYIPPTSTLWSQDGRLLWDAYRTVLTESAVALPQLSDGERDRLEEARRLLQHETDGGLSPRYEQYLALQQAYLQARERSTAAMLTAQNSDDPAIVAEAQAQKRRLDAAVAAALDDWRLRGSRDEIEDALATVARLSGRSPERTFAEALHRLDEARRSGLEPGTATFFDTGYLPRGLFEPDAEWTKLELDASEIASLTRTAMETTPDLEAFDSADQEDFEILSLSVEVARAELLRSWFAPDVITSRAWRWHRADQPPLSESIESPDGSLPAYATSMIFVRNLEVKLMPGSTRNKALVEEMQVGRPKLMGNIVLNQVASTTDVTKVARLVSVKGVGTNAVMAAALMESPAPTVAPTGGDAAPALRATATANLVGRFSRSFAAPTAVDRTAGARTRPRPSVAPSVRDHRLLGVRGVVRDPTTSARSELAEARGFLGRIEHKIPIVPPKPQMGGMAGRVTERRQGSVRGVDEVRLTFTDPNGGMTQSVVTDEEGRYRTRLAAGRYRIGVRADGYQDLAPRDVVAVAARQVVNRDFTLEREPAAAPVTERRPGVQLVAMVCRKLPKAPDPAPDLEWI